MTIEIDLTSLETYIDRLYDPNAADNAEDRASHINAPAGYSGRVGDFGTQRSAYPAEDRLRSYKVAIALAPIEFSELLSLAKD